MILCSECQGRDLCEDISNKVVSSSSSSAPNGVISTSSLLAKIPYFLTVDFLRLSLKAQVTQQYSVMWHFKLHNNFAIQ